MIGNRSISRKNRESLARKVQARYNELLTFTYRKQAIAKVLSEFEISRRTLYRYCRVWSNIPPWERTFVFIRERCRHNPFYRERGIKCHVSADDLKMAWLRDGADRMDRPSIDRINPNGNYTPKNIRYLEMSVNGGRKRQNVFPRKALDRELHGIVRLIVYHAGGQSAAATVMGVARATVAAWFHGIRTPKKVPPQAMEYYAAHVRQYNG